MSLAMEETTLDDFVNANPDLMKEFRRKRPMRKNNMKRNPRSETQRGNLNRINNNFSKLKKRVWKRDLVGVTGRNDRINQPRANKSSANMSSFQKSFNRSLNSTFGSSRNNQRQPPTKVVINNIGYDVSEKLLTGVLNNCAGFKSCQILKDGNGKLTGLASASFVTRIDAQKSVRFLSGNSLNGRIITASVVSGNNQPNNSIISSTPSRNNSRQNSFDSFNTSMRTSQNRSSQSFNLSSPQTRNRKAPYQNSRSSPRQRNFRDQNSNRRRFNNNNNNRGGVMKNSMRKSPNSFNWKKPITAEELDKQLEDYKNQN